MKIHVIISESLDHAESARAAGQVRVPLTLRRLIFEAFKAITDELEGLVKEFGES